MSLTTSRVLSRLLVSLLLGGSLLVSSGCYRASIIVPSVPPGDKHSVWVNGFLWGAVGGTVSADHFCGGRPIARIDTKRSFGNLFVSWITLGIYTPSKVFITCAAPQMAVPIGLPMGLQPPPPPYGYR